MDSIFYFDTEDSVSPPEAGCDDIVLWIAQTLERAGITGSFHVIGDKARILAARGRQDIINALQRHDVSSHYNHGSVHPTTTELVSRADWDEGVRIAREQEEPGFRELERIFGVCAGLTRHGGSYAPQIVRATGLCGKVFHGLPFALEEEKIFWFSGTLCISIQGLIFPDTRTAGPAALEGYYADDAEFARRLGILDVALQKQTQTHFFEALFGSHPHRMLTTQFSCWNHYEGVNRVPPLPPPQRPAEEKAAIKRNFQKYVDYLARVPGLKIRGITELQRIYGKLPTTIAGEEVTAYAQQVREAGDDIPIPTQGSAAEMLVLLATLVLAEARVPTMPIPEVIGPKDLPASFQPPRTVDSAMVRDIATQVLEAARRDDMIPGVVVLGAHTLSPGHALAALAEAWLARPHTQTIHLGDRRAYPSLGARWTPNVLALKGWRVFPPTMDFAQIAHFTQCQSWSVKRVYRGAR